MSTRLKAKLEEKIEKWIGSQCEYGDWPETFSYNELAQHMADAAFAVFTSCVEGQRFAKEQED